MGFLKKKQGAAGVSAQLRSKTQHPFGAIDRYVPLRHGEIHLYRAIREAVPIVDAAILKVIRLTGGLTAACGDAQGRGS